MLTGSICRWPQCPGAAFICLREFYWSRQILEATLGRNAFILVPVLKAQCRLYSGLKGHRNPGERYSVSYPCLCDFSRWSKSQKTDRD